MLLLSCPLVGGWSHLYQLFGLMRGSHTLLSAQKVPTSTCHLILRLLQQVAAAAAARDVSLDEPCQVSASQASEDEAELSSQQEPGSHHTYLSVMFNVSGGPRPGPVADRCSGCRGRLHL